MNCDRCPHSEYSMLGSIPYRTCSVDWSKETAESRKAKAEGKCYYYEVFVETMEAFHEM